ENGVGTLPFLFRPGGTPDRLPFRSHDPVGTILLELAAIAAVKQRIIVVRGDFQDQRQSFTRQRPLAAHHLLHHPVPPGRGPGLFSACLLLACAATSPPCCIATGGTIVAALVAGGRQRPR